MDLNTSVQYLKGVGPTRKKILEKLGISTVGDLLYYLPRRYEDRKHLSRIKDLQAGSIATIKAQIIKKDLKRIFPRRISIFQAVFKDNSGIIKAIWFNQPYLNDYFELGKTVILHGKVDEYKGVLQFGNPEYEIMEEGDESLNIGRIVSIYPLTEGFSQRQIRKLVNSALTDVLPGLKDFLHSDVRKKYNLVNLDLALHGIHFPDSSEVVPAAYRRLVFDEFLLFQLLIGLRRKDQSQQAGIAHSTHGSLVKDFVKHLPFEFTLSQQVVIAEILKDMSSARQMQRLLQGDVGSGKTVVATYAAMVALQNKKKCAFMVPTEILAEQHFNNLARWLKPLKQKVVLLTGSTPKEERIRVIKSLSSDDPVLVVGTHALIQDEAKFKDLSLIIIDEQHKFGVLQQTNLIKKGLHPHILTMTATPIPRSLALTIYGDLDISTIEEMPKGRGKINTLWAKENQRKKVYEFLGEQVSQGRQVFIVYPLVDDSEKLELKSAIRMFEHLKGDIFKDFAVGLVHGKMKADERNQVMHKFKEGKISILVSTIIIEVGIDIPNATCLVIEHAERFGLAQLHQLRGRIGRGEHDSHCILFSESPSEIAVKRIEVLCKTIDGFKISEEDLKLRGPGEFFGERQHGLWDLRIGNPITDIELLKSARGEAFSLLEKDSFLEEGYNRDLKDALLVRFPGVLNQIIKRGR